MILLRGYLGRKINTPEKIIMRYAPPADHNDTQDYIQHVCQWTGFKKDQVLSTEDLKPLIKAMCRQETGTSPTDGQLEEAWRLMSAQGGNT